MQEKFNNVCAVFGKVIFPVPDLLEPLFPNIFVTLDLGRQLLCLQYSRVYANNEHFLIMRAVKNADPAPLRQGLLAPPKIIVIQFLGRGCLNEVTWQPCGLMPLITCFIAPSLPAASIA